MILYPPIEGNTCNLDCLRKNPLKTFNGPVKVIVLDIPRREYCERKWCAGLIGLAYLMIGFSACTMLMYSCSWKVLDFENNLHILLCTLGFQLFMPMGILAVTHLNGPTAPLKPFCSKLNHAMIQICAVIMVSVGVILLLFPRFDELSTIVTEDRHCLFGVIAYGLMFIAAIFGPFGFSKKAFARVGKSLHAWVGLLSYICSTISFILAIFYNNFILWLSPLSLDAPYLVAIACGIAAFIITTFTAMRLCLNKQCDVKI